MNVSFGWVPRHNPESLNYRIKALDLTPTTRNIQWKRTLWLDQGRTSACTGYGLSHVLGTTPKKMPNIDDAFAQQRYRRAQQKDEWAGESYDGSSVLGAMEAAKEDALIKSYHWATTISEVKHAVSWIGPMEIGINWYTGMMATTSENEIKVTGQIEGGHALCVGGYDRTNNRFLLYNSWGYDWGYKGGAYITSDNLERLMNEQGEFALPRKVKP